MDRPVSEAPSLRERLHARLNAARKSGEREWTLLLGTMLASVKNRELELRRPPTDEEVVEVLRKGIKQRKDSVEQYTAGHRDDLAAGEAAEIRILESFLPAAVDPAEVRAAVREAIAAGATDVGKVMRVVMPRFKGRMDGGELNKIVREELQAG